MGMNVVERLIGLPVGGVVGGLVGHDFGDIVVLAAKLCTESQKRSN